MSVTVTPYFKPTSITGCRLWLDGADPLGTGTLPANASSLSTWFDKSGNGFNATANGTAATYNTNAVVFAGAQNYSTSLSSTMLTQSAFAVISYTGSAYMDIISVRSTSGTAGLQQIITSGTQRITSYGGALVVNGSAVTASTIVLYNYTFNSGASTFIYLNGTQTGTSTGPSISGSGTISIGSYDNNGSLEPFTGNMYELIIFNVVLTTTQRQQVESYLAQKWNFTSSLPADHPGKNAILYRSLVPTPIKVTAYSFPASTIVYTGAFIPYTVPAACTSLTFNMWGAGGPGGSGGMPGGGGAYLTGKIAVTSGEVLQLIVGRGGQYGTATQWSTMTNAEGGGGGGGGLSGQGGQGGGRTAIQKLISASYTEVVTAGGGGSAGGNAGTYGGNAYYTGTSQNAGTTYGQGRVPTGGSATAGGLNTFTARVGFPWDGTQFTGGFASNAISVSPVTGPCGGGGGGGGYYGGGGGGRSGADTYGGGGGGSYNNGTYITSFSGSNGTSNVAVASGIAGYITGCGRGGNGGSTNNGSNGLIVITPVSPNPLAAFKTTYFTPTQISNCLIWFDAADSTKFSLTGTTVNSWTSKGSYTGNATSRYGTVTRGTATFNGLNIVQFPVGSELGFTATIANQPRAWFAVFKQTSQVSVSGPNFTQYFAIINQTQGNGQNAVFGPGLPTNTGTSSYYMSQGPSGVRDNIGTSKTVPNGLNVMKQYAWINSAASTASNFVTVDATSYTLTENFTATSYATGSLLYTINTGWYNNSCDLAEIILYNGEITTLQRQQVEGYLAQKWGLTSSLPAGHPGLTSIFYRN